VAIVVAAVYSPKVAVCLIPAQKSGDWTMTKEPHEKELVDACLTIMEYCKEHKRCKGCIFWSDYTLCRMSKAPKRWEIWGVGKVKKNDKTGDSAEISVKKCGENDDE
jgi:hypothetical protein